MGAPSIRKNKDALGANFDQRTYDEQVNADGPHQNVTQLAKSDGVRIDPATSTKQPALGVAGTPSADVLSVQGVDGMTAVQIADSGTLIDGASMPAGGVGITGWLSAAYTKISALLSSTALSDGSRVAVDQRDGLAVSGSVSAAAVLFTQDMLGYESITVQVTSAGTTCTVIYETSDDGANWQPASGLSAGAVGSIGLTTTSTTTGIWQFRRVGRYFRARVSTYGSGTVSVAGTLSKAPVANVGSVNVGNSLSVLVQGLSGHALAIAGSPVRIGARAVNALYATLSNGQTADLVATLAGALISKPYSIPESDWNYTAAAGGIVNTTTAVEIKAAAAAGLRNYITAIDVMAEALGTATELVVRDGAGGAVIWRSKIGTAGQSLTRILFPNPIKSSAATLLEVATLTASTTGAVYFNATGYVAP